MGKAAHIKHTNCLSCEARFREKQHQALGCCYRFNSSAKRKKNLQNIYIYIKMWDVQKVTLQRHKFTNEQLYWCP